MKALFTSFAISTLLLTACGASLDVATDEEIDAYPEQRPVMEAWQGLVDAVEAEDCTATLDYFRISLKLDEAACPAIFEYAKDEGMPEIDWSRTNWSSTSGKAKIYERDGGSVTSFILDESTDTWRADEMFWTQE